MQFSLTLVLPSLSSVTEVSVLVSQQADLLRSLSSVVDKYLDQCGRRWVEMGTLFSMMKI